jgi:hypothetical protein
MSGMARTIYFRCVHDSHWDDPFDELFRSIDDFFESQFFRW